MNSIFETDAGMLVKYSGQEKDVCIPQGVTVIEDGAFFGCNTIERVTLPDGMKRIGRSAFAECLSLREINFPEGLEVVADAAFEHCPALESAILPDSVQFVGRMVFSKCTALRAARLPVGMEVIPHGTFMGDVSLTRLEMPEKVSRIEDFAFYFCKSLESLELPDLIVDVLPHTLYGCSGMKRGYIAGINLARYGPDEALIFVLLYLSSRDRYSYWETQIYEMFIREYRMKVCKKILDARSHEALAGMMEMGILTEEETDTWIEQARKTGDIEFTAKLLQYKQQLFPETEDMWEI